MTTDAIHAKNMVNIHDCDLFMAFAMENSGGILHEKVSHFDGFDEKQRGKHDETA